MYAALIQMTMGRHAMLYQFQTAARKRLFLFAVIAVTVGFSAMCTKTEDDSITESSEALEEQENSGSQLRNSFRLRLPIPEELQAISTGFAKCPDDEADLPKTDRLTMCLSATATVDSECFELEFKVFGPGSTDMTEFPMACDKTPEDLDYCPGGCSLLDYLAEATEVILYTDNFEDDLEEIYSCSAPEGCGWGAGCDCGLRDIESEDVSDFCNEITDQPFPLCGIRTDHTLQLQCLTCSYCLLWGIPECRDDSCGVYPYIEWLEMVGLEFQRTCDDDPADYGLDRSSSSVNAHQPAIDLLRQVYQIK
jgi:hypothetical protein